MTLPMLLWSFVALLALFGLVQIARREARFNRWNAAKRQRQAAQTPTTMDELARRVNESEAAVKGANQAIVSMYDGEAGFSFTLGDGRITGINIPSGQFNAKPATEDDIANPAEVMREVAVATGLEVDHESFDRAAEWLASPAPRKPEYRYRSAITGKFVKASYAKRYPHRTVRSKVKS